MSRYNVLSFCFILFAVFLSGITHSSMNCHKLLLAADQKVCRYYSETMPELLYVRKYNPYDQSPLKLEARDTLYIFDGAIFTGAQAIYNFSEKVTMPENSVLAGNQLYNKKARLVFENLSGGEAGLGIGPGSEYALSDVELVTYTKKRSFSGTLEISDAQQVTLDRVNITGYYEPLAGVSNTQQLLTVGCSKYCRGKVSISDSRFHLPYMADNSTHRIAMTFVLSKRNKSASINLLLNRTTVVLDNYSPDQKVSAMIMVGGIELAPGSICNSVIDEQGGSLDLLPAYHEKLLVTVPLGKQQAIGFTNGYGWGWKQHEKCYLFAAYKPQTFWLQQGIDLRCPVSSGDAAELESFSNKQLYISLAGVPAVAFVFLAACRIMHSRPSGDKIAL